MVANWDVKNYSNLLNLLKRFAYKTHVSINQHLGATVLYKLLQWNDHLTKWIKKLPIKSVGEKIDLCDLTFFSHETSYTFFNQMSPAFESGS